MSSTERPQERVEPSLAEPFLRAVVEAVTYPIFVKDGRHRFVLVNQAMCDLVGFNREILLSKKDHDLFPKVQADFFVLKDKEVLESATAVLIEEEPITDARGRTHILATTKAPLHDAEGRVSHVVGIIHDITQVKEAEAALRMATEELERRVDERTRELRDAQDALLRKERLVVLGQLSGGLAHQIRNPLSAIANAAAILVRRLPHLEDEDAKRALSVINEEVWEANRIITDLIDFARVKPPTRHRVPIETLVTRVIENAKAPPLVTFVVDLPSGISAWVDERQTHDAMCNIVRNAVEAMAGEGKITIAARAEGEEVSVSIEDTGPGIDIDTRGHLFEPLVTSKMLGLGLGLSTAKVLIENQGGTIRAGETRDGAGARFEIRVPMAH